MTGSLCPKQGVHRQRRDVNVSAHASLCPTDDVNCQTVTKYTYFPLYLYPVQFSRRFLV
jgi:hypothetical protein